MQLHPSVPLASGLLGLTLGLALSAFGAADPAPQPASPAADLPRLEVMEPIRALPRTRLTVAMEEARTGLARNRPWAAWSALRSHVEEADRAPAPAVLLAARSAAGWGGWGHVRELLRGREWLDAVDGGEGWHLLARAEEEGENWQRAAAAYQRYLAHSPTPSRGVAHARLGRALQRAGQAREAAAAFAAAAEATPEARDWLRTLQAEALAEAGDPQVMVVATASGGISGPVRLRQVRAEAGFWAAQGDTARALERMERESHALASLGAAPEAAALDLDRARLLLAHRRVWEGRELLRRVAADTAAAKEVRLRAARLLGERFSERTAAEELARAAAFEAAGEPGRAAKVLRAALAAGAPDDPETRLRLGKLLYEERDMGPARAALEAAAGQLTDPERAAEAELLAARARYRGGDRAGGVATLRRLVESRPGTRAAGTALFLLGDDAPDLRSGIAYYRRAAATTAPEAREALYRVGDRSLKAGDPAAAVRAWTEYVERYPKGEETARVAYLSGVLHERAGREGAARGMYRAAIAAEPLSYFALRAGERAGMDPLEVPLRSPAVWVGTPGDLREARTVLARLDALESAGLEEEWNAELRAALRRLESSPAARLTLAEGLRDRGHAVEGIRLGRRLLAERGGEWDARLLRVVFPYPYRDLLEEKAREMKVDPALLAGLVRQESSFNPTARSWVGATGLAQIMPATGKWMAPRVGIYDFRTTHLTVPEVSLEMGARYLRDQLRRYDGAGDLALAAYNAGPGRADRWRRELGYGRNVDDFREKIPFAETRHYVQVVLRNAAVYRRIYGERRSPGLVAE